MVHARLAQGPAPAFASGIAPHHPVHRRRFAFKKTAGLRRPRLPGGRRLHGPRQLGHGHRRRLEIRLLAVERDFAQQFDGDVSAGAFRQAGHRHRARPGASLPRKLFPAHRHVFVGGLRNGHRRLRPGRSAGLRRGAEIAFRIAAARRRADHRAGRADCAGAAGPRLPA